LDKIILLSCYEIKSATERTGEKDFDWLEKATLIPEKPRTNKIKQFFIIGILQIIFFIL